MKTKGDPENARLLNRSLILNQLKEEDAISRAELSRVLNLSKMTISAIVADLIAEGLICETGEGEAKKQGGRKPILLTLPINGRYVLGLDIGLTNTTFAIGNLKGELIQKYKVPTRRNHSLESILEQIKELVDQQLEVSGIQRDCVMGLGVSIGGLIKKREGYISLSPDFNWKDVAFKSMLEELLDLPIVIDNCTRAMALGEKWYGGGIHANNIFYVNVGHGIGSAIVCNRRIYENNSEFGHIHITKKDVRCDCGKFGCLEAVSSGQAIEKVSNHQLKKESNEWLTARDVAELGQKGNTEAITIFDDAGKYLGRALSIAANLFNPDKIIIAGGVSNAGSLLMKPVMEEFKKHTMDIIKDATKVEFTSLGMDAGVVGSITLALDEYVFHSNRL